MKNISKITQTFACSVFLAVLCCSAENVLTNGSFEKINPNNHLPANWNFVIRAKAPVLFSTVNNGTDGKTSIKIKNSMSKVVPHQYGCLSQRIKMEPDQEYIFSFSGKGDPNSELIMIIGESYRKRYYFRSFKEEWEQFSVVVKLSASELKKNGRTEIRLNFDCFADVQIDDVKLVQKTPKKKLTNNIQPVKKANNKNAKSPETYPILDEASYKPMPTKLWQTASGSALDLSFMQDAPAGKYGRLIVRNGHFEFEQRPGKRVRFYGINLCSELNVLSHEESDRLADQLAKMGYNSVRFHHFDNYLVQKSPNSTTIDPVAMDKMDYLAAALKKRGLYFTIDFYCSRIIRKGDFPEVPNNSQRAIKTLVMLIPSAMKNWKRFTRNLLTHKNPYTGLQWGADPALITASMINEDPAFNVWTWPEWKALFEKRFNEMHPQPWPKMNERTKRAFQAKMVMEIQLKAYNEMRRFIHEDLGFPIPTTGCNYKNAEAQSFLRESFDYVDNHSYYNHPAWRKEKGRVITKTSAINPIAEGFRVFRDGGNARIFGKPFFITETNYLPPNRFRSTGGAILGVMGAFQDYDGFFRFDYAHTRSRLNKPQALSTFHIAQDPINELSERMGILFFLRNEFQPAERKYIWLYDQSAYMAFDDFGREAGRFPFAFGRWAVDGQIGCAPKAQMEQLKGKNTQFFVSQYSKPMSGTTKWPDWKTFYALKKKEHFTHLNGHFEFSTQKEIMRADSEYSEVISLPQGQKIDGKWISVENQDGYATFFITAIDGKKLPDSKRMLLLHLSDVQNTGIHFLDKGRNEACRGGGLPLLIRSGKADLSLKFVKGNIKAYALDLSGKRISEIPVQNEGKLLKLKLDVLGNGQTLAYELIRK